MFGRDVYAYAMFTCVVGYVFVRDVHECCVYDCVSPVLTGRAVTLRLGKCVPFVSVSMSLVIVGQKPGITVIPLLGWGFGHTQRCSELNPASALRGFSWKCSGDRMGS